MARLKLVRVLVVVAVLAAACSSAADEPTSVAVGDTAPLETSVPPTTTDASTLALDALVAYTADGVLLVTDGERATTVGPAPVFTRWSRDGRWLVTAGQNQLFVYDADAEGEPVSSLSCAGCDDAIVVGDQVVASADDGAFFVFDLPLGSQPTLVSTTIGDVVTAFDPGNPVLLILGETGDGVLVDGSILGRSAYGGPTTIWHVSLEGELTELVATEGNVGPFRAAADAAGTHVAYAEGWRGGFCVEGHAVSVLDLASNEVSTIRHPNNDDDLSPQVTDLFYWGGDLYGTWRFIDPDVDADPNAECAVTQPRALYRAVDGAWVVVGPTKGFVTRFIGEDDTVFLEEQLQTDPLNLEGNYVQPKLVLSAGDGLTELADVASGIAVQPARVDAPDAQSPIDIVRGSECSPEAIVDISTLPEPPLGLFIGQVALFDSERFRVEVCGPAAGRYYYRASSYSNGNSIAVDATWSDCRVEAFNLADDVLYVVDEERILVYNGDEIVVDEPVTTATCSP